VPNWNGITMPDTTPMPNDTAKIRSQNVDSRRYTVRRVAQCSTSSVAMKHDSPTVNAGSRI